jgi:hypothetical protein
MTCGSTGARNATRSGANRSHSIYNIRGSQNGVSFIERHKIVLCVA